LKITIPARAGYLQAVTRAVVAIVRITIIASLTSGDIEDAIATARSATVGIAIGALTSVITLLFPVEHNAVTAG
tara:strand:+ start:352 stop:573 length:222 start_codon:yes stop_codon:yes gene_type:complete